MLSYPQPTPPPKQQTFKSSLPSFRSSNSLRSIHGADTLSIASGSTTLAESRMSSDGTWKKSAAAVFGALKKVRSRSKLRPDRLTFATQEPVPPLPSPTVIPYNPPPPPPASPPPPSTASNGKRRGKGKEKEIPPPVPSKDLEFPLDTNIDNMEGIIDLTVHDIRNGDPSSPSSAFESAHSSGPSSDVSSSHHFQFLQGSSSSSPPSGSSAVFINPDPFSAPSLPQKRKAGLSSFFDGRRIGPKQQPPFSQSTPTMVGREDDPSWTAPESWAVVQGEEEIEPSAEYMSSEGEETLVSPNPSAKGPPISGAGKNKKKAPNRKPQYKFRIYRANNTYHVASIALNYTVGNLIPYLNGKLLHDPEREKHRLYLKERGRGKRC